MPGSRSRTQTSVQQAQPWGPQAEALMRGFGRAEDLYQQGPWSYFPGSTVAPFTPETNEALSLMARLARQGAPATDEAGGYLHGLLGEGYLTSNPAFGYVGATARGEMLNGNPHLDAMFGRAARQIRDQVNATFGASGRTGSGYHADVLARNLGEAANDVYYRNYAQERANQLSVAGRLASAFETARQDQLRGMLFAPELDAARYLPADRLAQVGALREAKREAELQDQVNRFNYEQQAPYELLARYMGMIGGPTGTTSTSLRTVPRQLGHEILEGAALGNELAGGAIWGSAIGGLLGLL